MITLQSGIHATPAASSPYAHGGLESMRVMAYLLIGAAIAAVALGAAPVFWRPATPVTTAGQVLRLLTFGGSLVALTLVMFAIGIGVTGRRMGVLWSARNTYSLARLQIVLWTLLILSALAAMVACRVHGLFLDGAGRGLATALNIDIPTQLLTVMGISVASSAAAPAILSLKSQSPVPSQPALAAAAARTGDEVQAIGRVAVRPRDATPLIRDIFQGDEIATAGTVDVGKLQQFIVTLLLLGVYFAMLLTLFLTGEAPGAKEPGFSALPQLSDSFVYLLGISHAGYLAYKAAPAVGATSGTPGGTAASAPLAPSRQMPRPLPPAMS